MDNVHPTGREHTHIETLIQPPRDLDTQEQEDKKHIEVMLADFSALLVQQTSSQGIDSGTDDGNGNIRMEYALQSEDGEQRIVPDHTPYIEMSEPPAEYSLELHRHKYMDATHLLGTVSRYPSPDFDSSSLSFPYSMTPLTMDGSRCFHCTMTFNTRPAAIHSSQEGATKHSKLSVQRLIPAMRGYRGTKVKFPLIFRNIVV